MRFKLWIVYGLVLVMFSATVIKMATVMVDRDVSAVGNSQGRKTITVASARGTFYDRHLERMVNVEKQNYVALLPEYETIRSLKPYMSEEAYRLLLDKAVNGMPLTAQVARDMPNDAAIYEFKVADRYGDTVHCANLLGYIDQGTGHGVSGLEKVYDDILSQYSGSAKVSFVTDGLGMPMEGQTAAVSDTTGNAVGGVKLTIDNEIQAIVDEVAERYVKKGAVIVMDAQNGEVLAMGSYPSFHPNKLEESLENEDDPFVNRAISLYDCGSVFKIVTTMAALEYGVPPERSFECCGEYTVDETVFHCHNRDGHGLQNMETAFANSCNAYYIQLALEIGADTILRMMDRLGLNEGVVLTDGWETPAAVIPSEEDLSADAALANLSFGQGHLMLTPLQTALLAGVIASGGNLLAPEVVSGLVDSNKVVHEKEKRGGETVVSSRTVRLMRGMMRRVVTDGTGSRAQGNAVNIAGKTGTAETGQRNSMGYPVVQSWFVGYFPAEHPRYVVTILAEDAQNTEADTALAACEISNKVAELKRNGG